MEFNHESIAPDQKVFFDLLTKFRTQCINYGKTMKEIEGECSGFSVTIPLHDTIADLGVILMELFINKP